jgi:hypothetical protein
MNTTPLPRLLIGACIALAVSQAAMAADLSQLKGLMGGSSSGASLSSGTLGNAAGVLGYCAQNNYLSGNTATDVKDKVLAKLGASQPAAAPVEKSNDYLSGLKGVLNSGDGKQVDLGSPGIKETITKKVCDAVLKQGKSFL